MEVSDSFTSRSFHLRYPLSRRLRGSLSRLGRFGGENVLVTSGDLTRIRRSSNLWSSTAVPKVCCEGPATSAQGMGGQISVVATSKFTYILIKGIKFC